MTKEKLIEMLKSLEIPINEGIQNDKNTNVYPRIVFWEYGWDPIMGSGVEFDTNVRYQISFFSKVPRDPKLIELKERLKEKKMFPYIEHEYIQKEKYFHSFFPIDIQETIE